MPELTSVRLGGRNFYSVEHVRIDNAGKMKVTEVQRGEDTIKEHYWITSRAFGIELGIVNSVAAVFRYGSLQMAVDRNGSCITPSYVYYPENGYPCPVCGFVAKDHIIKRPKNVIHDFLPLVGVKYSDPVVKHVQESVEFTIVDDGDNMPVVVFKQNGEEKRLYPEQVSSCILEHLKKLTRILCGFNITDVVISVPVWFSSLQRQLIRDAAVAVGLNPIRVIPDPVAAAYAYADVLDLDKWDSPKGKVVLVYDLRSTSFSATVQKMKGVVYSVLAYEYDLQLGGNDFDRLIRDDLIKTYKEEAEEEYGELSKRDIDKLLKKCEDVKIDLRVLMDTEIVINDDIDWTYNLSRSHMNDLISGKIDESIRLCDEAITKAGLTVNDIDEIVLVGGSTRLYIVEEKLRNHFPHLEIKHSVKREECIATGAARYADTLSTGKYFVTPSHP